MRTMRMKLSNSTNVFNNSIHGQVDDALGRSNGGDMNAMIGTTTGDYSGGAGTAVS